MAVEEKLGILLTNITGFKQNNHPFWRTVLEQCCNKGTETSLYSSENCAAFNPD